MTKGSDKKEDVYPEIKDTDVVYSDYLILNHMPLVIDNKQLAATPSQWMFSARIKNLNELEIF